MSSVAINEPQGPRKIFGLPIPKALGKSTFAKAVVVLSGGTAIAQILNAGLSPVLTRLYTPQDFGTFAIFASALTWLLIASCLRYEHAIPVVENSEQVVNVVGASLLSLALVTIGVALGVWFLADSVGYWVGDLAIAKYLWLLPLALFLSGVYQILSFWALRENAHSEIARTRIFQTLAQLAIQVTLGIVTKGPLGLVLGGAIGRSAGTGRLLRKLSISKKLNGMSWSGIATVAKRQWRFPCYSMPGSVLHAAGFHLPPLLLAGFFGAQVAGWFSLQERVLAIPLTFLAQAVAQAFYAEAARLAREKPQQLKVLFRKTIRNMFFIGIVPIGFLGLSGPYLFAFVFGENWREAGVYAQMLCAVTLLRFCVGPVFYVLTILQKQSLQMIADILGLLLLIGGFILARKFNWEPSQAILVYGAATFLVYSLLLCFSWREVNRHSRAVASPETLL